MKIASMEEVRGHGNKSDIPKKNITPTVRDIGLTSKQIHQARKIRDAEKHKPGYLKTILDAKLEAGKEPKRADMMGATKSSSPKMRIAKASAPKASAPKAHYHAR
jgi:hypothetical protein